MSNSDYNKRLVSKYGTRVVSVSYGRLKFFTVKGTEFIFQVKPCPVTGKPILHHAMRYPNGMYSGPEKLELRIKGNKPCEAFGYSRNGNIKTSICTFRLTTSLAIRDLNRPRRKRRDELELKRAAEAAEVDWSKLDRGGW